VGFEQHSKAIWNPVTRRHELEFVNHQDDLLFILRWDPALGAYAYDGGDEGAAKAARGAFPFDARGEREAGARHLERLDRERPDGVAAAVVQPGPHRRQKKPARKLR
jgi:hypothetical protein